MFKRVLLTLLCAFVFAFSSGWLVAGIRYDLNPCPTGIGDGFGCIGYALHAAVWGFWTIIISFFILLPIFYMLGFRNSSNKIIRRLILSFAAILSGYFALTQLPILTSDFSHLGFFVVSVIILSILMRNLFWVKE